MVLSEKTLYSLGRRCVYISNRRKAKKEIPVYGAKGNASRPGLCGLLAQAEYPSASGQES